MKVEAIPNKGPASMGPEIDLNLCWAEKVDIASAFVTRKALNRFERTLSRVQKEKRALKIRLLFGLYQRFTPPDALAKMLALQKAYPSRFYARVARNSRFHWKLYSFRKGNSVRLYVGSTNLMEDGITSSGELSIKISAIRPSDTICRSLETEFDTLWSKGAFSLNNNILRKYRKVKRPVGTARNQDDAISNLLENAEQPPLPPSHTLPNPRVVFVDRYLLDATVDIIRSETEWDRKNWTYMGLGNAKRWHDIIVNAKVFLYVTRRFDGHKEFGLEFRRVEETAELDTTDGKYFIAHSRVPNGWLKRYSGIKQKLSEIGLTWKKIKRDKHLSKSQLQAICHILHVKPELLLQ